MSRIDDLRIPASVILALLSLYFFSSGDWTARRGSERTAEHLLAATRGADPSSEVDEPAYSCEDAFVDQVNEKLEPEDWWVAAIDCDEPDASGHTCLVCGDPGSQIGSLVKDNVVTGGLVDPSPIDCQNAQGLVARKGTCVGGQCKFDVTTSLNCDAPLDEYQLQSGNPNG